MLKGKTAFVTGGSGAVGAAIVRVMAREGCRVAFSYKGHPEQARKLEEELRGFAACESEGGGRRAGGVWGASTAGEGTGGTVRAYELDVLDAKASVSLAARIEQELGPVDILVNNAGVTQILPFAMIEEKDWDVMMDVNVKGTFLVTKAFARGMIRRKAGCIINLGSLAGMRMLEVPVHYATAKSAIVGFTTSLAREFGRYNIRVNAVAPGMLTDGVSVNVPDAKREEYKRYCALSREGRPEEVAELVAFLAGDRASYINAQTLLVDGGI